MTLKAFHLSDLSPLARPDLPHGLLSPQIALPAGDQMLCRALPIQTLTTPYIYRASLFSLIVISDLPDASSMQKSL